MNGNSSKNDQIMISMDMLYVETWNLSSLLLSKRKYSHRSMKKKKNKGRLKKGKICEKSPK